MTIPEAFDLALQRHQAGRLAEAEALYRQILSAQPKHADALHLLGVIAHQIGRHDAAVELIRQAIALDSNNAAAHCNLGEAWRAAGQFGQAIAAYRRALELQPDYPQAHNNLGAALASEGQLGEAMAAFRRALQIQPNYPEAHNNLGAAFKDQGALDEAIASYRSALRIKPDHLDALYNLACALAALGLFDEAIAGFRRTLQVNPNYASAHSNLIHALHYHAGYDARMISEEHEHWNQQFGDPLKRFVLPHANVRNAERPLRIGYVSPDFRDHPVGRFVLPLFERHDPAQFEILCYSGVLRPDPMTERLRALAGGWRNTVGVPDAQLAEMIRADRVDILVDLTLHTAGNRLTMFARQPAPIQVAWLGYPGSTGLRGIGYRLTDARLEPPGQESAWSSEERVRLPDCWCCYHPVGDFPDVNALPALSAQGVTFGSLNNFAKVNEGVLACWARMLEAVKGSRLVMRCPEGRARERVRAFFGARGIGMGRLELVGYVSGWEYLKLYQRIDLGLDPFPYNGTTTTCEALWMGAPVLTLPGAMPASRAGLSLMSSIGLGEFAAASEEDYLRIAAEWAGNLPRLADLRATLRARMQGSPLMDAPRFARNVEAAYRSMWKRWIEKQSSSRE